jgi:hypothetical protein
VLITGPCGVGKSWLACALGHDASRADRTVLYHRLPRLFSDLELARGDGRFDVSAVHVPSALRLRGGLDMADGWRFWRGEGSYQMSSLGIPG